MQKAQKREVVAELSERLGAAKCLYLTDFTGLDVAAITELRRRLTDAQVEYVVVKNTLARRALSGGPYEGLSEHLGGPNAFAMSNEDVVTAAKILTDFAKEREKPQIRAGAIEGRVVSIDEIRRIAELPPRDELLAQMVGYAKAPMAGLVYTLNGLLAKFVRTVDALREQKASAEPAAAEPEALAEPAAESEIEARAPAEPAAESEIEAQAEEPVAESVEAPPGEDVENQ